jgi:eukaryotic-like serine/threonine-protein kinase
VPFAAVSRAPAPISMIGRYALCDEVAHGGMATVHIGRLVGPAGFSKTVAIKKMHGAVARNPEFIAMFLDEARLSCRIQHPNAVGITDVIAADGEVFLIMEYVHGEPLSTLCRAATLSEQSVPIEVAVHILRDALYGLHAAHEACDEHGEPLLLVHRDVSPQNILVGVDGVARVCDFGIAKAVGRMQETRTGQVKGKISYMAPEQLLGKPLDRRVDVFAAGVVLWETLAGRRLFAADSSGEAMYRVLEGTIPPLAELVPGVPAALAAAVTRATAKDPTQRFGTAKEFARALEGVGPLIPAHVIGDWVREAGGDELVRRGLRLREIESTPISSRIVRRSGPDEQDAAPAHIAASPDEATRPDLLPEESATAPARRDYRKVAGAGLAVLVVAAAVVAFASRAAQPSPPAPASPSPSLTTPPPARLEPPAFVAAQPTVAQAAPTAPPSGARALLRKKAVPRAPTRPSRRPEDLLSRE